MGKEGRVGELFLFRGCIIRRKARSELYSAIHASRRRVASERACVGGLCVCVCIYAPTTLYQQIPSSAPATFFSFSLSFLCWLCRRATTAGSSYEWDLGGGLSLWLVYLRLGARSIVSLYFICCDRDLRYRFNTRFCDNAIVWLNITFRMLFICYYK